MLEIFTDFVCPATTAKYTQRWKIVGQMLKTKH